MFKRGDDADEVSVIKVFKVLQAHLVTVVAEINSIDVPRHFLK